MDKARKREFVSDLASVFQSSAVIVAAHYDGLTVADMAALRAKAREEGAKVHVVKNRLAKIALHGSAIEAVAPLLKGQTVLTYANDPLAAPKAAAAFAAANDKFKLRGGAFQGRLLSADDVKALAALPPLDVLRAKIVGVLQAPAAKIVGVLQAPGAQIARVISAYANKEAA